MIINLKHRASVYRMTDFGSAGKRGYTRVKRRVKCLILPSETGSSDTATNISQTYKAFFNPKTTIRVSDKIVSNHQEYIVSGVSLYHGLGNVDHVEADMERL